MQRYRDDALQFNHGQPEWHHQQQHDRHNRDNNHDDHSDYNRDRAESEYASNDANYESERRHDHGSADHDYKRHYDNWHDLDQHSSRNYADQLDGDDRNHGIDAFAKSPAPVILNRAQITGCALKAQPELFRASTPGILPPQFDHAPPSLLNYCFAKLFGF
jgi:hypothetical protein